MNANKLLCSLLLSVGVLGMTGITSNAFAVDGLNATSQTKVNGAMAKRWQQQQDGASTPTQEKRMVNIGSRRNGDCNVNVGTVQPGQQNGRPKDIVVTTKEVINVCR